MSKPLYPESPEQKLFLDNVWFIIDNAATLIMKTPELAMTVVPCESGLSMIGGFYPTLGTMVSWWLESERGNIKLPDGTDRGYALCNIMGSSLTGVNSNLAVDRKGNYLTLQLRQLTDHYAEMRRIQRKYNEKYPDVTPMTIVEAIDYLKKKFT